jgi:formiminoglutamate deiminase
VTTYACERAVLPSGEVAADVLVEVTSGRITQVEPGVAPAAGAERLHGLVLPGAANAHSHAFHRALRGRTHAGRGSFWTWRELMYDVAERLDPDTTYALARAVYAEMVLAGFTSVGEFHYLHHQPDGTPYDDPNELGLAHVAAAADAGLRITLLDTCYLAGGIGEPLTGVRRRFGDGDADVWAARVGDLAAATADAAHVVVGAAVHSVRAVPRDQIPTVVTWADAHAAPLHAHVSEQPAENDACLAAHGATPVEVLAEAGMWGPRASAVHATHLSDDDIVTLGGTRTNACFCPTTERDLADGVGPAHRLLEAGAALTLGTDSHAVIDAFEEARAVELDLRLATLERGHLGGWRLLDALTADGQASLGWDDAGRIAVGARADLVAVDLRSVRTAGTTTEGSVDGVVFAATAADVTDVVVDGQRIVRDRQHRLGDVGELLSDAIGALTGRPEQ